jgi:hypothetical protein
MGINFHPMLLFRHPTISQLESAISKSLEQATAGNSASEQSAQPTTTTFPLATLNRQQLEHLLQKSSK